MRKIIVTVNVLVLFMFWLLAQVAVTPAHNLLVQYAETGVALPILTDFAIQARSLSAGIPLTWAIITIIFRKRICGEDQSTRSNLLALHSSVSLLLGLVILFFFALAGILPVLKIGAVFD